MPGTRSSLLLLSLAATVLAGPRHRVAPSVGTHFCDYGTDVPGVTVPAEFCVRKFADVQTPRVLLFAPNGDLFVSSPKSVTPGGAPPGAGAIFLFRETQPAATPQRFPFAQSTRFKSIHGLLIANGSFYYTLDDGVYRDPYAAGATAIDDSAPATVASFATTVTYRRFPHSLAIATDGTLYVTRGQFDNPHCPPEDDRIGSVLRIGEGHPLPGDIVANGFRNPLTMRCMSWGACYAIELSGDGWEAVGGTEKLVELHDGDNFGYPCCVKRGVPNPELPSKPDCSTVASPDGTFPLHDTPFGFDWERDFGWPAPYKGAFFVGKHGDYADWAHAGLQWAPTDAATHLPASATTDFMTGVGKNRTISRVADIRFAPDGRLFFTDDQGGAIYWIAPRALNVPSTRR
jgi:glucose/arabinose dehydrogenase